LIIIFKTLVARWQIASTKKFGGANGLARFLETIRVLCA